MSFGSAPFGTAHFGGIEETAFDIQKPDANGNSIISIGDFVGKELIRYFQANPKEMLSMDRRKFEELVAELFHGFGYEVELTQKTRDGGKDIIAIGNANQISSKYLIECKRPNPGNPIGVGIVRELMGVKADEKATKAIAVTTSYFTQDARIFEERNRWELELKEYSDLVSWLNTYKNANKTN